MSLHLLGATWDPGPDCHAGAGVQAGPSSLARRLGVQPLPRVQVGARVGDPIFTDSETVKIVQQAILALPQYKTDAQLSLAPYGADGKWGPTTARAVARFNDYYRAGGAPDSEGPYITQGTLDALKLSPVNAPSGTVPAAAPKKEVNTDGQMSYWSKDGKKVSKAEFDTESVAVAADAGGMPGWKIGLALALGFLGVAGVGAGIALGRR